LQTDATDGLGRAEADVQVANVEERSHDSIVLHRKGLAMMGDRTPRAELMPMFRNREVSTPLWASAAASIC
jgi:hypothetical protein